MYIHTLESGVVFHALIHSPYTEIVLSMHLNRTDTFTFQVIRFTERID